MALYVKSHLFSGMRRPPGGSYFYFKVGNTYLSRVYEELQDKTEIFGKILAIRELELNLVHASYEKINIPELEEKETNRFILMINPDADWLYISQEDWHIIRDYGIIKGTYEIEVRIDYAVVGDKKIPIYPKKDVDLRK